MSACGAEEIKTKLATQFEISRRLLPVCRRAGQINAGRQRVMHCPCGNVKVLALALCATCYTLKRQDEGYFGALREAVLERDSYCCRVCDASGRDDPSTGRPVSCSRWRHMVCQPEAHGDSSRRGQIGSHWGSFSLLWRSVLEARC